MNVFNVATAQTYEVVVVIKQRLRQLEVSVVAPGVDPPDGTAANQDVQVAIDRTWANFGSASTMSGRVIGWPVRTRVSTSSCRPRVYR